MAADDAGGLKLVGITPDSPADKGGLKSGDVIVEFDGKPVKDLYTYSDALYARKPGDSVKIVVKRAGVAGATERVTLSVTLGRRGE
jgi:serine protease Do